MTGGDLERISDPDRTPVREVIFRSANSKNGGHPKKETTVTDDFLNGIERALGKQTAGVYRVAQQTATFVLGSRPAPTVWAQTCGVNLAQAPLDRAPPEGEIAFDSSYSQLI